LGPEISLLVAGSPVLSYCWLGMVLVETLNTAPSNPIYTI